MHVHNILPLVLDFLRVTDVQAAIKRWCIIADPGDGEAIPITESGAIKLVSGAAGETRTLARPTRGGMVLLLWMYTDGGGDIVVSTSGGHYLNQTGNQAATFGDVGDYLLLVSMGIGNDYSWRVVLNDGVGLA